MRAIVLLFATLLLLGCISFGERGGNGTANETNLTNETPPAPPPPPPPPSPWKRYLANGFSFEHPVNMEVQDSSTGKAGIFSGTHTESGQTYEVLILTYTDTIAAYGVNKDEIFRDNPNKAASDLLAGDMVSDSAGVLDEASETGDITIFSIERGTYAARVPFKINFGSGNRTFSGQAINIYVPERSLHVKVRIFALDPEKTEDIMDAFLLTFRLE